MSSGYSEEDIRRAAEIREWLIKEISDRQEEVERLRTTLSIIDNLLKQGSFKAAANLGFAAAATPAPTLRATADNGVTGGDNSRNIKPLKRAKDDFLLANAEISPDAVVIVPAPGINLNANTPPFKSFFLNRILEGM